MFKRKPFPFSLLALLVLITLHSVGSYYSWYWVYPWFDIIVHMVSGLWIASVCLWLASVFGQVNLLSEYRGKSFLIAVISAVLLGLIWELLENLGQITFTNASGYGLNTAFDVLSDTLGGILAFWYFVRRKKCVDRSAGILHPFNNQTGIVKN